jgi:cation diffusion facilitator family transporter
LRPGTAITERADAGRRIAIISIITSLVLATAKIITGWLAGSAVVVADGFESAGDVFASAIVLFGIIIASLPADKNHPYGHGRFEMLTGLGIGAMLAAVGVAISVNSLRGLARAYAPESYAIWPLMGSVAAKSVLSVAKFRVGRRIQSGALIADAWNDAVDILSGTVAIAAVSLALYEPSRFARADRYGAFAVGIIVLLTGLRVIRDTSLQLMDTMPDEHLLSGIREVALGVPGVLGVEKLYARKTGFQYHVDLHLEVDPEISVRASHAIAQEVRLQLKQKLDWVADVLVHVEPAGL